MNEPYCPPCVGCGYCCSKAPCGAGAARWGMPALADDLSERRDPCKGLVWDPRAGRHWCRLVLEASGADRARLTDGLAIGGGCCSPMFNTWRAELKDRTKGDQQA